jgi:hypothetical protein
MAESQKTLSDEEQHVLAAIVNRSMIGGAELMSYTGVTKPDALIKIVRSLHAKSLIEVSGDVNEKMLPYATFGIRPSAREYLVALLKQQQL